MKSVYDSYPDYWKNFERPELKLMLSSVTCIQFPAEKTQMMAVKDQQRSLVVVHGASMKEVAEIIQLGFEHVLQADRPDFPQELLAATLMAARFDAFVHNPIPFFFTGFREPGGTKNVETNMAVNFKGTTEKVAIIDTLTKFLSKNPKVEAVRDLCVQAADEMLSNALYSAPVDSAGNRLYQDFDRTTPVSYPPAKQATLFAGFSDYRVVIGVEDPFGSLSKTQFWQHLNTILTEGPLTPRVKSSGAGLGIRFMIDNSANFYVYSDRKKRTVFACGFLLKGVRANLSTNKHLHCSFR